MKQCRAYIDFSHITGAVKNMHSVNNGPLSKRPDQTRDNFDTYAALKIPLARNHDAAFCADYGGEHTVDVHNIFPNFDADENDPASYDFTLTDEYTERTFSAGTETFYRLGSKIEHNIKKYGTLPPKDFGKWARICEHIIAHMTEGWAEGHFWPIRYWEIWNEPDIASDSPDYNAHKTWGGTKAQFYDFFETAAKHLKARFPNLYIGGPATTYANDWLNDFLKEMSRRDVPMDFVSWHTYHNIPENLISAAASARKMMAEAGYGDKPMIVNEWNYISGDDGWATGFIKGVETIHSIKGAAYTAAFMNCGQRSEADILMYYDARLGVFNALWDYYTLRPLAGYYAFKGFSALYALGYCAESEGEGVYLTAATDGKGGRAFMLTCFTDDDADTEGRAVALALKGETAGRLRLTRTNAEHLSLEEEIPYENGRAVITLQSNEIIFALVE